MITIKNKKKIPGFSLPEIILPLALISMLAGFILPVGYSAQTTRDLKASAITSLQQMRRAQMFSQNGYFDQNWGIQTEKNQITLFQGQSYINRNQNFDEIVVFPVTVSFMENQEIVFAKNTGSIPLEKKFILQNQNGQNITITITPYGKISLAE